MYGADVHDTMCGRRSRDNFMGTVISHVYMRFGGLNSVCQFQKVLEFHGICLHAKDSSISITLLYRSQYGINVFCT